MCVAGQEGQATRSGSGAMLATTSHALSGAVSHSLNPPVPTAVALAPPGPGMLPASFGLAAGMATAPTQRLSAMSGHGHAAGRSGYWNLSPGVHVPSVAAPDPSRAGLASLVATRPAAPGPTISSGDFWNHQLKHCSGHAEYCYMTWCVTCDQRGCQ